MPDGRNTFGRLHAKSSKDAISMHPSQLLQSGFVLANALSIENLIGPILNGAGIDLYKTKERAVSIQNSDQTSLK